MINELREKLSSTSDIYDSCETDMWGLYVSFTWVVYTRRIQDFFELRLCWLDLYFFHSD